MFFWPSPLTWFFVITAVSLISLFVIEYFVSGRFRLMVRLLIHMLSVALFLAFLWYLSTLLIQSCSPEITQTVVFSLILFVALLVILFYYIGRRKI